MKPNGWKSLLALAVASAVGWTVGTVVGQQSEQIPQMQPVAEENQLEVPSLPQPSDMDEGPATPPAYYPPPAPTFPSPSPYGQFPAPTYPPKPPMAVQPVPYTGPVSPPATPPVPQAIREADLGPADGMVPQVNAAARQEPAVSLEWIGPQVAKLGMSVTYQIVVKNVSSGPVQQVVVHSKMPAGVQVQGTEPKAIVEGSLLMWELGTLHPQQERRLDLAMVPESKGDLACQATVTFTGMAVARLKVREPKLVLKAAAPERTLLGDIATISLTVSNPGDGVADHVKVKAMLPDGLEHTRGKSVELDLGNIGPNEHRSVQLVCVTKASGTQHIQAVASADGNLRTEAGTDLEVVLPRIDVEVAGPRVRYLDRPATFVFKVTNPGSAPASNVTVSDTIPAGFKFVGASDGGRHDFSSRSVSWYLGDLTPGQSREVTLQLMAVGTGDHKQQVTVLAARGLKAEGEIVTHVEGLSALLMELVDIDDPVEVGADTAYEVRITNTGSKTETNLQLICTIPERMEFRGAVGAGNMPHHLQGQEVVFDPLPRLAPRADAIYRIQVRGAAAGDLRFRARITADGLSEAVLKEESTKVYGDEALPR